tara:strand:- start:212 stop:472 length:261 start_codon:yes stop_codon:yes gene_type:complete
MTISITIELEEKDTGSIYNKVINQVEINLLTDIMRLSNYNQSKAATILGISRGNLRTKLSRHFGTKYNAQSLTYLSGITEVGGCVR